MQLVEYSDSDTEDNNRLDTRQQTSLPSLPPTFLDLYSSTVRTSTTDDPSLHAGRKRIKPHAEGTWPTHVYLEWFPSTTQLVLLNELLEVARDTNGAQSDATAPENAVHSLLNNDLGVSLPLHVSLSRPLSLRTEQKDDFNAHLGMRMRKSRITAFCVHVEQLNWHPNEDGSRQFLVLSLSEPSGDQLRSLLAICNEVAADYDQPLLYPRRSHTDVDLQTHQAGPSESQHSHFHISIAWALKSRLSPGTASLGHASSASGMSDQLQGVRRLDIPFTSVKIRTGQDVITLPLAR